MTSELDRAGDNCVCLLNHGHKMSADSVRGEGLHGLFSIKLKFGRFFIQKPRVSRNLSMETFLRKAKTKIKVLSMYEQKNKKTRA